MEKFYVITNRDKDVDGTYTKQIASYIRENGRICILEQEGSLTENVDCVLVLGGDGTLLRAARDFIDYNIPFLGINLGTLGYLAEIDKNSICQALDQLFADKYTIENRMMLKGIIYHNDKEVYADVALNDIVISRDGHIRVVRFNNYVNGEFLYQYKSDGMIIATATGSTGYSLSAGGPIVTPEAEIMIMTPLAPHTLNTRSIIFKGEDHIMVEIGPGRTAEPEKACAHFDGAANILMETGDRIVIRKASKSTKLVKINNISFLEVLREKMRD